MAAPAAMRLAGSSLTSAISQAMVDLYAKSYGHDRTTASTYINDNVVVCVLENILTDGESHRVAEGGGNGVIFNVDDCRATYEALLEKGVEFTQEPTEHFYGIDCGLRDPFGNPLRITQPAPQPIKIPTPEEFAADAN